MTNVITRDEIRKELGIMEEKERDNRKFSVNVPKERRFVNFSFSAKESFSRFEAVKEAQDIMKSAINNTGGNMTSDLIDAYEGLNAVMERIKTLELDLVKFGR